MSQEYFFTALADAVEGETPGSNSPKARQVSIGRLRALCNQPRLLLGWAGIGVATSLLVVLVIPKRFQATTQLMAPDSQSGGVSVLLMAAGRSCAALRRLFQESFQFERIGHFPLLFTGAKNNETASVEIGFAPGLAH